MIPYLHMSADDHIRSEPELTRFLFWLDTTLDNAQKLRARNWGRFRPKVKQ